MRLGIFGGTFDPPHIGHLLCAIDAVEALSLDRLVFVPAGVQPLKTDQEGASPAQRVEMVRRLIGHEPNMEVSAMEVDRGGLSYSVDTLAAFADRFPGAERFFLVGADVLGTFGKWRAPERVAQLATVVVLQRGEGFADRSVIPGRSMDLPTRRIDVSSTEIRARVKAGQSIRGFVPDAVAAYIASERLYR